MKAYYENAMKCTASSNGYCITSNSYIMLSV